MYFLNLSLLQFLAVFGSISAISVALYLLDRSRRKQVVSTLRFWVAAEQPAVAARRRRIQQPWSLLAAIAQHGAAAAGHRAIAPRHARAGRARSRHRARYLGLDGRPLRQSHAHGRGTRTRAPVSAGAAGTRPRDAGARRRHGHAGHCLRSRSQENRGRASRLRSPARPRSISTRRCRSRATCRGRTAAASAKSPSSVPGRTAPRDPGMAPLPRNLRVISDSRQRGKCRAAQDRHAAQRRPTPNSGRSMFRCTTTAPARTPSTCRSISDPRSRRAACRPARVT